ncbi:hypothetical protein JC525_18210 [Alteromonas sp. IB21]|uniref:hypothetical protein n=1 Tax=Alteromonas sp. IB21 TaxID=2779369 RepID=UPI0018E70ABB|nr:hypothetical protein [Alteromonas sp. IB21]MBJ2130868.1 hypothetical protein [Alteromonas sp. IB21]
MKYVLVLLVSLASLSANAALITSNTTFFTTTGSSFSTSASVATNLNTNAFINYVIKGDYSQSVNESFRFFIDGILLADWSAQTPGLSVTNNAGTIDYTIVGTVNISDALWSSFISDGILNISWQNGSGVNYSPDGGEDFVSYEIFASASSVTVPASAPNVLYLLLCSMGILAVRGFKTRS